jgi:hypothetical protein
MSTNPYSSPQGPGGPQPPNVAPEMRERLREVARSQKLVIYALLAQIVLNVAAIGMNVGRAPGPQDGLQLVPIIIGLLSLVVAVFSLVAMYKLCSSLGNNPAISILFTLLMCVPCISLVILLVKNGQATSMLQAHGVKVSFMGADPDSI